MSLTLFNLDSNNFSGEAPPPAQQTVSAHILHGQDAAPIRASPEMPWRSLARYGTELPGAKDSKALPELHAPVLRLRSSPVRAASPGLSAVHACKRPAGCLGLWTLPELRIPVLRWHSSLSAGFPGFPDSH